MDWLPTLITVLFTSGGIGSLTALRSYFVLRRKGKVETEETIIKRIEKQSVADSARTQAAELRADKAEEETESFRQRLYRSEERAAYFKQFIIGNGLKPPKWPPDDWAAGEVG